MSVPCEIPIMKRLGEVIGLATELGLAMGLTAAGLVVLGLWLGRWLDARLGTNPWATILLLVAGAVAGQVAIYRLAIRSTRRLSANERTALTPQDAASATGQALQVLALVALPGIVGLALGMWIDHLLGTRVIATLILVLGGLIAGVIGALRLTQSARAHPDERGDDVWSSTKKD